MRFTISIVAAVVFSAIKVNADFIAWSGTNCDGSEGLNVPCDNTCFDFQGRHSFEVSSLSYVH
jgi:hypothetical protein